MRRNTLTVLKKSNLYFQLIKIKVLRLWVLESPVKTDTTLLANNSQHCWMLRPFAHHCQQGRNNSQNCWPNIAGNCCILLNTTANKEATTHNIVGPTLLRVVASFCMQLKAYLPKMKRIKHRRTENATHRDYHRSQEEYSLYSLLVIELGFSAE